MTKNVANNVVQGKVQDLTEQWKKGELKRGMYWVVVDADGDRSIQPCVYGSEFDDFEEVADEDLSFITAGNINQREHYSICWEEVLAPVPSYKEWQQMKAFCEEFNALKVAEENNKLKELLKRCRDFINYEFPDHCIDDVLIDKIDEVLK